MTWIKILIGVGSGALNGAAIALLGYGKSSNAEEFDWKKAAQTTILGAIIGGIAGAEGMNYQQAQDWAEQTGAIIIAEYALKSIWRYFKLDKKISKALQWLSSL